jgi:hypothetical protein
VRALRFTGREAPDQIAYDIYYATHPAAKNFTPRPPGQTPSGATSFRTPGLPSHGDAYFIVRATNRKDRALLLTQKGLDAPAVTRERRRNPDAYMT